MQGPGAEGTAQGGGDSPAGPGDETRQGRIHRELRDMILTGRIAPGTRLRETELSGRFGSSRAPLREAIRRLESEGLVQSGSWRGSWVARHAPEELLQLYTLRGLIEGYAATRLPGPLAPAARARMAGHLDAMAAAAQREDWLAVAQHDTAWHREIVAAADLPVLLQAWEAANGPLQMTFGQVAGAFYGRHDIHARHHAVLDALGRPPAETEAVIRDHYIRTAERLLATVAPGAAAGNDPRPAAAGANPPDRARTAPPLPAGAHATGGTR